MSDKEGIVTIAGPPVLVRNCNGLLEPRHGGSIVVHSNKLPARLLQQAAIGRVRAFLSVEKAQHLSHI